MENILCLDIDSISSKINSKEDLDEFCKINGKIILNYNQLDFYIPKHKSFNFNFFIQFLEGKKNVE